MAKRVKFKNNGSILTQLESWESTYFLSSEGRHHDKYFNEHLELFTKVTFSEHRGVEEGDLIKFYIIVEHDMQTSVNPPKYVSSFNHSKKCRTAYVAVHKSFLDNFRFLISCGKKPYIAVFYLVDKESRYINITSLDLVSSAEINDYRTC